MSEIKAVAKNLRGSPRKARRVADAVRGKNALYAIEALRYMPNKSALDIRKVVQSAVANAVNNNGMNAETLIVKSIMVDSAFTIKRMRAQSRGRGRSILKRNCHITVLVDEPKAEKGTAKAAAAPAEVKTEKKTAKKAETKETKKKVAAKTTKSKPATTKAKSKATKK
ncbi:50S ribosomal protein L22 [Candidatus Dojkabacteria bacterium]|uniref:Large ribosomal subunit protein uL22 n=1 Tax=Candidatus Dojkabacteria bacterium TaxID=2099670 RepID=A0A955I990_9BACT|nr:50S ribosomal protein L22 [Candidatus Dojkabacteria bacterium]